MCGIAGILGSERPGDKGLVERMVAVQGHRGPNREQVCGYAGATLGHARLSILDLSDRATQPMVHASGRYVIVFNGEIYNFKELRTELSGQHKFTTTSDTEVLLTAYVAWGEDCVAKLDGMFAFCIYDIKTQTAFLCRDRFGQKPFYFTEQEGRLLFSSEIKGILATGYDAKPDMATWARYLVHASYDDNEYSYFNGIIQLQPGECATWSNRTGLTKNFYYRVGDYARLEPATVEEASERVRDLMVDSVRIHMRSDVPVGVSLSGGLDSSALLACIAHAGKLHEGIECVSVEFTSDLSERQWIESAAWHHGLNSTIIQFSPDDFYQSLKPMMWHLEGPLGGLMNSALAAVMKTAQELGVTVIQDGTGLDEAFAGYRNHHNLYIGQLIAQNDPSAEAEVESYAKAWGVSIDDARRIGEKELSVSGTAIDGTVMARPDLLDPEFARLQEHGMPKHDPTGSPVRDALVDYLQVRKIPRNTRMKDRISMAYGLELRLPFLDHRLVEYALSLPEPFYFLGGWSKSIVRNAMAGIMDDSVRLALKRSIQAPQGPWLQSEPFRTYIRDMIRSERFASRGMFNPKRCQEDFELFCEGRFDNSFFVWQWINVEEWFQTFIDNDSVITHQGFSPKLR